MLGAMSLAASVPVNNHADSCHSQMRCMAADSDRMCSRQNSAMLRNQVYEESDTILEAMSLAASALLSSRWQLSHSQMKTYGSSF